MMPKFGNGNAEKTKDQLYLNKLLFRLKKYGALKCSIVLYEHFKNKNTK